MKIVNLTEFLAMAVGTIFAKYQPCVFGPWLIKEENAGVKDFFYQSLEPDFGMTSDERYAAFDAMERGESVSGWDLYCAGRDGLYEDGQLFAVLELADAKILIDRLYAAVDTASQ